MEVTKKRSFIIFALLLFASLVISNIGNASAEISSPLNSKSFTRNLTIGDRGNDVSALQQFLITSGFLKILTPTGYFGPATKTALSAWQTKVGVYPSAGFFGSISRGRIDATVGQIKTDVIAVSGTIGTTTTSVLTIPPQGTTGVTTKTTTTVTSAVSAQNGLPVRIKIPKLRVDAGFQYNGLKSDGTMEIPDNITDVGWFTGSPHPGEKGASVVTGHVAQIRGGIMTKPGVFYNLNELRAGDPIYIQNDKGNTLTFVVRESRSYDPSADATPVFTAKDSGIHLNIITCEGTWSPGQLSYSERLVIFADLAP